MKKQIAIKIMRGAIIFTFAIIFIQAIFVSQASAANGGLNWENPNKSGDNPYKFKPKDAINSQLIMQVVGCTGVVDKVSNAITGFVKNKATKELKEKADEALVAAVRKQCETGKKTLVGAVASVLNTNLTDIPKLIDCKEVQETENDKVLAETIKARQDEAASKRREECFNGIAITLAKNQLTSMTRYTMNWVNTGFNGDPMYVRDITSFTNSLERNVLETGINALTNTNMAYPYGTAFSRSAINSYKTGTALRTGATNFLDSLTSDLSYFVTDPRSYYSENALERANNANNIFASDFSTGGWDGWLALTQRDRNNPLGFAMQVSQYLGDQQTMQVQNTKDELLTNNGFLSQKRCVLWELYDRNNKPIYAFSNNNVNSYSSINTVKTSTTKSSTTPNYDRCIKYEVVTPGSLIKEKMSTYINSPERQLELADTINESLNALFTALIAKFQNQGLSSLSSESYIYDNKNMGVGAGSNDIDLLGDGGSLSGSGYVNGSFDLTRDLGNTFIHTYRKESLGFWDAKNNIPELNIGVGPVDADGNPVSNVFYIVSKAGNTKLIENGYNGWSIGDRAFWNGSEWQNWKKGTTNPISKRGVIQTQKDYVVVAREILMTLPSIMPKMGELDYCIPGPNPNWRSNVAENEALFGELSGTLTSAYHKGSLFRRKSLTFSVAGPGDPEYDNYRNVFRYTAPEWWTKVTSTHYWNGLMSLGSMGRVKGNQEKRDAAQARIDNFLEKINVDMRSFYDSYGAYVDNTFGNNSLMQKQFIEYENKLLPQSNPAWLSMAEEGLDITKDIVSYNDDIITTGSNYKDAIIKANANIAKLTLIKNRVSEIIKAAQKRRADRLATLEGLTPAQLQKQYGVCLVEEDVVYYDDLSIIGDIGGDESLRCNDGMDNDLDGLIDELDKDCDNYLEQEEPNYACILDLTETEKIVEDDGTITYSPFMADHTAKDPMPEDNDYCTDRSTSACTTSSYYNGGLEMHCKLNPNAKPDPAWKTTPGTTGIYYKLMSCQDNSKIYQDGPNLGGYSATYGSGVRVQGATGQYYVIIGSEYNPIQGAVATIETSSEGKMGCPQ